MVAHVCRYLLSEDVRGVVVLFATTVSHDVVSILQVPLYGPYSRYCRILYDVSVSRFAQSLRFCFQHAAGYSFVLCSGAYCQVCTVGSSLSLVQLQCMHSQQLACCLVLGYEYRLVCYISLEPLYRSIRYWRIQPISTLFIFFCREVENRTPLSCPPTRRFRYTSSLFLLTSYFLPLTSFFLPLTSIATCVFILKVDQEIANPHSTCREGLARRP